MIFAIGLLLLAVVLVILELSFPSFGMLSLGAATAYAFALVQAFKEGESTGWTFVGLGVILLPAAIAMGLKILPKTPFGRRLFLAAPKREDIQRGALAPWSAGLVGSSGLTVTDLRPSGTAEVQGRRIDVVAAGGTFIPRGSTIAVTAVDGTRIVVDVQSPTPASPGANRGDQIA